MKSKKLILYDCEADYIQRMSEYLQNCEELSFEIHSYTDFEKLKEFLEKEKADIFLIGESAYDNYFKKSNNGIIMILKESSNEKQTDNIYIEKFQRADQVVSEILENYARLTKEPLLLLKQQNNARIIGFYSPIKRCLQTSAAMVYGRILAKQYRTLYLNFEAYAGVQELLKPGIKHDLSDLLYFFENTKEKFLYHLQAMTERYDNLAYVPPMFATQNLIHITGSQWMELLSEIARKSDYDYIILDLSDNMQGLFDILRICTQIYTITKEDKNAIAKMDQYKHLLQMYEYQDVLHKTRQQVLPMFQTFPEDIEEFTKSDLVEYIQKLIKEDLKVEFE